MDAIVAGSSAVVQRFGEQTLPTFVRSFVRSLARIPYGYSFARESPFCRQFDKIYENHDSKNPLFFFTNDSKFHSELIQHQDTNFSLDLLFYYQ